MYEEFLIRGPDIILAGWRWLYEPQVGVSTPCGAVSTRWTAVSYPFRRCRGTKHDSSRSLRWFSLQCVRIDSCADALILLLLYIAVHQQIEPQRSGVFFRCTPLHVLWMIPGTVYRYTCQITWCQVLAQVEGTGTELRGTAVSKIYSSDAEGRSHSLMSSQS